MIPPPYPRFTGFEPCATSDPELFFPEKGVPGYIAVSKVRALCIDRCHMRTECLDWAVWQDDDGIWAATTRHERRAIRKERGIDINIGGADKYDESRQSAA